MQGRRAHAVSDQIQLSKNNKMHLKCTYYGIKNRIVLFLSLLHFQFCFSTLLTHTQVYTVKSKVSKMYRPFMKIVITKEPSST